MFTILSRIIHYGLQNFWRNGLLSAATVAIMVLALIVLNGLLLFNFVAGRAVSSIQDKIDISVWFKTNVSEDDILNIKQSLESLAEVKSVEYISRDKALQIFKELHKEDAIISQGINELDTNPLEASLNIKARDPNQYASIASYLKSSNLSQYIDDSNGKGIIDNKNQAVIDRLSAIVSNINRGGLALTILLAAIAGLVVFNTIRIAIHSGREEISVMRLVGASNSLVWGPLMVDGVISGFLGAFFSLIAVTPIVYFLSPRLDAFIPGLNLIQYFYSNIFGLFLYQLAFGIGIGALSSFVAVRRYLKN